MYYAWQRPRGMAVLRLLARLSLAPDACVRPHKGDRPVLQTRYALFVVRNSSLEYSTVCRLRWQEDLSGALCEVLAWMEHARVLWGRCFLFTDAVSAGNR